MPDFLDKAICSGSMSLHIGANHADGFRGMNEKISWVQKKRGTDCEFAGSPHRDSFGDDLEPRLETRVPACVRLLRRDGFHLHTSKYCLSRFERY